MDTLRNVEDYMDIKETSNDQLDILNQLFQGLLVVIHQIEYQE